MLIQTFRDLPPVTRCWSFSVFIFSVISKGRLVYATSLTFVPEKAFYDQPWRLITSFCYLEDLLLELILELWFLTRISLQVEETFITKIGLFPLKSVRGLSERAHSKLLESIEKRKSVDYLYFFILLWFSIIVVTAYGAFQFGFKIRILGRQAVNVLLYYWCLENPNHNVNYFGFNMKAAYAPWFFAFIFWSRAASFPSDMNALFSANIREIVSVFFHSYAWEILSCYGISHFWWFNRNYLLLNFYYDQNESRRRCREENPTRKLHFARVSLLENLYKCVLHYVLVPPWYWTTLKSLNQLH